jgi:hypothetical protein
MDFRVRYRNNLVELGDGGKVEDLPFIGLAGHEAGKIIHVDALHDDDDGAGAFVVEAGQQGVLEPFVAGVAFGLGIGVVGLQGVVDNDHVATAAGQRAPDRGRESKSPCRQFNLALRIFLPNPRALEQRLIPGRLKDCAKIVRMLLGEIAGVRDTDDSASGVVAQDKGRKRNRRGHRFERARGHVDDQAHNLAAANALQLVGDCLKMPVRYERLA